MGEETKIQWCHHTLNPWIGCAKVSAGCKYCYASVSTPVRVLRAKGEETWGADAERHETREWARSLRRWNREALADGERRRVFCASLADVFEAHSALPEKRARLWPEIEAATGLDIMLLTKRPENVLEMVPPAWLKHWPAHVWPGTTVEDQEQADKRIQRLLRIPAVLRFLSCEPLLGPVDLSRVRYEDDGAQIELDALSGGRWRWPAEGERMPHESSHAEPMDLLPGVDWVIAGGESGPGARPCDLAWLRSLRAQCRAAEVPFFMKQLGAAPCVYVDGVHRERIAVPLKDKRGGEPSEWPADLRAREFPRTQ